MRIKLVNGTIVDGSGRPGYRADLLEAFEVSEKSGVRLHVSHLKRLGAENAVAELPYAKAACCYC